ncbi:MAG: carbohydrate kinase family protein [Prochlorotrichaceae cyanobacterium]
MTPKPIIHVFGEVLFDCFPDGKRVLGGAPFNVAWNLQGFGLKPQFMSRIGDDLEGKEVLNLMTNWGMNCDALQTDVTYPTGLVQVKISDREPHYDIVTNSAYDFIDEHLLPTIKAKIKTDGILYHGSLGIRNPISLQALQAFKANHQGKIFVDVNLRDPWWQRETLFPLLNDANWVKVNEHELAILLQHLADAFRTGSFPTSGGETPFLSSTVMKSFVYPETLDLESDIKKFCQQFDLDIVIVTLGEQGAIVWDKQQFTRVKPTANIQVVDTVGAGDAFVSVFLLGLSKQWTIGNILEKAQAFAGEIVMRRGATTTDRDFYQSFSFPMED